MKNKVFSEICDGLFDDVFDDEVQEEYRKLSPEEIAKIIENVVNNPDDRTTVLYRHMLKEGGWLLRPDLDDAMGWGTSTLCSKLCSAGLLMHKALPDDARNHQWIALTVENRRIDPQDPIRKYPTKPRKLNAKNPNDCFQMVLTGLVGLKKHLDNPPQIEVGLEDIDQETFMKEVTRRIQNPSHSEGG